MSNWLDLPNTSNRFIQIYVKGFVDISGGKLIVRNDDVSFNNRIFIGGDVSFNSNLFVNYDVSLNSRLTVGSDITTQKRLFTIGDVSLNGNLFVNYDVSLNSRLTVGSDITTQKRLFTIGDVSLNGNLFVNYDVSLNSRLTVGSDITIKNRLFTLGDASFTGNLYVKGDAKFEQGIQFNLGDLLIPTDNIRGGVNNYFGRFTYDFIGKTMYDINTERFLITRTVLDTERYNFLYSTVDLSIGGNISCSKDISLCGNLYVGNNISITGRSNATSFETASDYRIKANVQSLLDTSFTVDLLKPVTYMNKKLNRQDIGFIAHEVQEQIPFLVRGNKDDNELQSINYNGIIGILTKEIQELKKQNNSILQRLEKADI